MMKGFLGPGRRWVGGMGVDGKFRIPLGELYRIRIKDVVCTI